MKKWKLRLFKSGSLAVTAAVLASVIAMPGVLPQVTASETPGVNCTSRIEPDTYIANSLSVEPARNYTALYNDGMYDGGDKSLMLPMGPLMYSTGETDQVGELTYRLPYAVSELKITGIEVPDDAVNAFKGFWISQDGYNWTAFSMTRIRTGRCRVRFCHDTQGRRLLRLQQRTLPLCEGRAGRKIRKRYQLSLYPPGRLDGKLHRKGGPGRRGRRGRRYQHRRECHPGAA